MRSSKAVAMSKGSCVGKKRDGTICGEKIDYKNMCKKHARMFERYKRLEYVRKEPNARGSNNSGTTFEERMNWYLDPANGYIKIDKKTGCWLWQRFCLPSGYGLINARLVAEKLGTKNNCLVHRATYFHATGHLGKHKHLDHLCRNPNCCNPTHLEEVDASVNNARKSIIQEKDKEIKKLKSEIRRLEKKLNEHIRPSR